MSLKPKNLYCTISKVFFIKTDGTGIELLDLDENSPNRFKFPRQHQRVFHEKKDFPKSINFVSTFSNIPPSNQNKKGHNVIQVIPQEKVEHNQRDSTSNEQPIPPYTPFELESETYNDEYSYFDTGFILE